MKPAYIKSAAALVVMFATLISMSSHAANWSTTELHVQYGKLDQPFDSVPNSSADTTILTFQHSSGWDFGTNFFFVDYSSVNNSDSLYLEWYPTLSTKQVFDVSYNGLLSDIRLVMGINAAPESDILKYLPGVQLGLNVEGFNFLNVLIAGYIDDNEGIANGGAPKEENSWIVDVSWSYPVAIQQQQFYIDGHAEYINRRKTEITNRETKSWVLAQVQVRWDVGKALSQAPNRLFAGIEYQYWNNKLGTDVDENAVQLLGVWRF
ncbi:hypothetical protein [Psychrosphaera ytuae]|nr:hypothetical protein [Psychrosphaera ytuae]